MNLVARLAGILFGIWLMSLLIPRVPLWLVLALVPLIALLAGAVKAWGSQVGASRRGRWFPRA